MRDYKLKSEKKEQSVELSKGYTRKETIERDLELLKTDEGVEKILIEKNNLKKPGERVINILDY